MYIYKTVLGINSGDWGLIIRRRQFLGRISIFLLVASMLVGSFSGFIMPSRAEGTILFSDGFESGSLGQWTGYITSGGETVSSVDTIAQDGIFSARFASNGTGGTERAYVYKDITEQSELYVRGYFYIGEGLPLPANEDRFNFIALQGVSGNVIASAGIRRLNNIDVWSIPSAFGIWNATVGPSMNQWYSVELYTKIDSVNGAFMMWVDGTLILEQTALNTTRNGNINRVRCGVPAAIDVSQNITVYGDSVVFSTGYIGPAGEEFQRKLTVDVAGNGTTNPAPGVYDYVKGCPVAVQGVPDEGWQLNRWLLNGSDVGSANPYWLNIDDNYNLTAVFVETAASVVFHDGFESGDFSAWTNTQATSGEVNSVVSYPVWSGNHSALVASNGDFNATERAYAYVSGLSLSEVYALGYFKVTQSGIVEKGDASYYIMFASSSASNLAYAGWRRHSSGNVYWHLMIRNGTDYASAYSVDTPLVDTWYSVELHWKQSATIGLGELYVNGVLVCSLAERNTDAYGNAGTIRFGLPEIFNCTATSVVLDNATIATAYVTPEEKSSDPVISYVHVWGYPGGLLDPAGSINTGEKVRIYTGITDAETSSDQLTVTIKYKAQADSVWTITSAQWESNYGGYWYYDWTIPGGASLGLYDVTVEVSDGHGGSASTTENGEFTVILANVDPVVNYVHVWGYPGGLLDPAGSINTGEKVRIYTGITDAETSSDLLSVTISYKAHVDLDWTVVSAQWESNYGGYWYYDWTIPGGATTGLYDVMVEVSDGDGGTASVTEYGEFTVNS
jgi:hypothetical protein